jgi:hypothetical protein
LVEDTIQEVVERIHRYGDRERNVGNLAEEREAREAALDAQHALTVEEALRIEAALQDDDDVSVVQGRRWSRKRRGDGFSACSAGETMTTQRRTTARKKGRTQ